MVGRYIKNKNKKRIIREGRRGCSVKKQPPGAIIKL